MRIGMKPDKELLEAYDAEVPRVDLVAKAANGSPRFLMMKGAGGLLDARDVRGLLAKAAPHDDRVTAVTGSPDDVARAMHAIHRATQLQKESKMPDLIKADEDTEEAAEVLADGEVAPADEVPVEASGDPDDPTAPAWEAVDAARARQALELVLALQRLLKEGAARENQELALGTGDMDDVFTLEDALSSVEDLIDTLAPFAIGEQAEADDAEASLVLKSGRVLSSQNKTRIEGAAKLLSEVLSTLPAEADGTPLEKETQPVDETTPLEKAKGDPLTPVYDESGKLVGMVDAADLVPIAPAGAAAEKPDEAEAAPAEAAPAASEAAPAAAEAAPPAAPDAAPIPGTDTVQSPVVKSTEEMFAAALAEVMTPLAKRLGETAGLADLVKGLQERVENIAKMPDDRKSPALGAATGTAGLAHRDGQQADVLAPLRKAAEEATDPVMKLQAQTALAHAAILQRFQQG